MGWFEVDAKGLAALLERRGKGWAIAELVQNAWDADGVTKVDVRLTPVQGRSLVELVVEDNSPGGFIDLTHGWTLFAPSAKKGDPEKRGKFNFGEKCVLALAEEARIDTTTGAVEFRRDGERVPHPRQKRAAGTRVWALIRMTRAELAEALQQAMAFIPPANITTTITGTPLAARQPIRSFLVDLETEAPDEAGVLRPTRRRTTVELYTPLPGRAAQLFEMGLPVVETGDRWDVNVGQKIPLTLDRSNVPPRYLRRLRVEVLERAIDLLMQHDASAPWVAEAVADQNLSEKTLQAWWKLKHGNAVLSDRRDQEAGVRAMSREIDVVPESALPAGVRQRLIDTGIAKRAGDVFPSARAYSQNGTLAKLVLPTPTMTAFARFAEALCARLGVRRDLSVQFVDRLNPGVQAAWGDTLDFGVETLGGPEWFEGPLRPDQLDLLIHEFGHESDGNHLADAYFHALTRLAGELAFLALREPTFFDLSRYRDAQDAA